jgi:hypothetical protein
MGERNHDLSKQLVDAKYPNIKLNLIRSLYQKKKKSLQEKASGIILSIISNEDKFVILGKEDLFCSNCNYIKDGGDFSDQNPVYHI